jgi:hypothetical protein
MGFDDIFDNDHRRHKYGHDSDHNYGHKQSYGRGQSFGHDQHDELDDYNPGAYSYSHKNDFKQQLLLKLQNDPKFKSYIIIGAILVLIILLIAAIVLLPFLIKLLNYFSQNGIQGIIDTIWKGTK